MTDAKHEAPAELLSNPQELEAPAEGAGERDWPMSEMEVRKWVLACNHEPARNVLREYIALRARSSAPEAREGEAVAWLVEWRFKDHFSFVPGGGSEIVRNQYAAVESLLADLKRMPDMGWTKVTPLAPVTAAPSADKLRIAVEALEVAKSQAERGADKAGCDGWRAQEMCRQIAPLIDQALAALKAEGC